MRPTKGIVNLANLKVMFIWLGFFCIFFLFLSFVSLNLPQMQKVKCKCLHALQPCRNSCILYAQQFFSATLDMSSQHNLPIQATIYPYQSMNWSLKKGYLAPAGGHNMMQTALQIRAVQQSITASFWPLTTHIYHVTIIMTGEFSKISFIII